MVTCFDPLRVYVYKEGIARFASEPYNSKKNSKYSHLTNYSINKKNENYIKSEVSFFIFNLNFRALNTTTQVSNGLFKPFVVT